MPKRNNTHSILGGEGDVVRFIDYGPHGMTVETRYDGEWVDVGFGPGEIPALIEWLTNTQKSRS